MPKKTIKKSKKEKYKKPAWLIKAKNEIEKLSDEELDELFETTLKKLKKGGLREALGI
ncbi:conserved protein of unknown function [Methanocaldococcus lauensis]|uniref:Uncharacterized protein n=1 Tax=Methanocaldococcus lauensis TaxID=2546128 RepID=A0A8D6SWZ9_9EURY|nr:hypothetical protein [Methanocaldococcus lauensis]CAB3288231.1 conserved protein of unknown function [Methanocaldococcus lauensis]